MNKTEFYLAQLRPLVGGTITNLTRSGVDEVFGDEFFGLEVTQPTGEKFIVWFYADNEGNGPGSFEIQYERGAS